jgi:hypothetical protein
VGIVLRAKPSTSKAPSKMREEREHVRVRIERTAPLGAMLKLKVIAIDSSPFAF